jgi:hypothetical protein
MAGGFADGWFRTILMPPKIFQINGLMRGSLVTPSLTEDGLLEPAVIDVSRRTAEPGFSAVTFGRAGRYIG